ncbi:MAG: exodeoxyribonuclease VII large subunit [Minisyncoccota bacterium]
MSLIQVLRLWRDQQARLEGVETFRVFPNAVLEAIVNTLPRTKEEVCSIKGIKEAKYRKYGTKILKIIETSVPLNDLDEQTEVEKKRSTVVNLAVDADIKNGIKDEGEDQTLSVSQFLDGLNIELSGMASRVRGEVSSVDERERVVYFTIKDASDDSTLSCLIFRNAYDISGVRLAIGDEIIVEGAPDIYKSSGRLSLKVGVIELCGEGALQKAYEALKLKFEQEGLFTSERKRSLPAFAERIALITSEQGAAIGDFTMNLGSQGLKVYFYPTSVEGKKAVFEIIRAIRYFNRSPDKYDVLVIVRGGGSLESLQAFNNEALAREVAGSKIPTLLGIGHEKDVTLAALIADVMVSTPTATAKVLRAPWDEARQLITHFRYQLPILFREKLSDVQNTLAFEGEVLLARLKTFSMIVTTLKQNIIERLTFTQSLVRQKIIDVAQKERRLFQGFLVMKEHVTQEMHHFEELLRHYDPQRVLQLGYSLVRRGEGVVKDITEIHIGDILDVQLSRGRLETKVEKIIES